MKIAINTRFLIKDKLEGIGVFTFETLKRISQKHPEHEFLFLFDRTPDKTFLFSENVKAKVVHPQARHPLLWFIWFEFSVPYILKKEKADLFISTDGFFSLRTKVPGILVIHDLAFEEQSHNWISLLTLKYLKRFTPLFARKAKRIVTVSEFSKKDISEKYKINPGKIDVVFNGADNAFMPISGSKQAEIKKIYSRGCDYFLYAGAIHPRKNLNRLLLAFDNFKDNYSSDIKLIIVGRKAWKTGEIFEVFNQMKYKKDVVFTGRVSKNELVHLMGSALALTYVPLFEGFGIPIIEAQKCRCPVITSNITSMPEVAGDSALLADPYSVNSIATALIKMATDTVFRDELITKGKINADRFSWESTAEKFWESIMKAAK